MENALYGSGSLEMVIEDGPDEKHALKSFVRICPVRNQTHPTP